MNRNDFINMIEDTVPVNRQMIGEVSELINIFPYFQSAHLLLLKGLYTNADVKFENQLRNSAIHIGDREVLYWLLKPKTCSEPREADINNERDLNIEIVTDSQQNVIESAKNSELLIDKIEKNSDESNLKGKEDAGSQAPGYPIMLATEPDTIEPAGVIFLTEENPAAPEEKVFFMDPGFSLPDHSDLLELDLDEDEEISRDEDEIRENTRGNEPNSDKLLQAELIDKFIIANPRIEPQKDKTYVSYEDISRPFVEEAGGLVTETLAKIYIGQGYYSRAIDIYEKLSLKFPEKSSYFAVQIEKVKEYIKK